MDRQWRRESRPRGPAAQVAHEGRLLAGEVVSWHRRQAHANRITAQRVAFGDRRHHRPPGTHVRFAGADDHFIGAEGIGRELGAVEDELGQ